MLIPNSQFITPPAFGNCFFPVCKSVAAEQISQKDDQKIALLISHSPKVNSMITYRCKGSRKKFSQAG